MTARSTESKALAPHSEQVPPPMPPAAWWLPGPHLPTLFAKFFRTVALPATLREKWPLDDGDALSIERLRGRLDAPRLVLFHGLEGGTHSAYARGFLQQARARGWAADLVLWRTCDGQPVNAVHRAYHSGASDDAEFVINRLLREDPNRPLLLAGVSLGGNVLLKWLGERGSDVHPAILGAVAISVPFDLAAASRKLERGFSRIYSRFFLKSLKAKTLAKLERFPGLLEQAAVERVRTLWEFDDAVTGPIHGFESARDYYERSSSIRFLERIRVPTLLVNAEDDPFLPRMVLDEVSRIASLNPHLTLAFPARGGHAGFVGGRYPWAASFWMEGYVMDWFNSVMSRAMR
jgi:predicted alpha/beta-fold hydrolase